MTAQEQPRGTIYDLGYQGYDGPRLGRRFAIWSLYVISVRNAFGLGRGILPKALAFGLVALAFFPAVVQLILAAVVPVGEFEFVAPHEYYGFIQVIIVLFVAALASELVGNDRRSHTLALYFSRPIQPSDYALAKLGAMATSLLAITALPQAVLFVGNYLGSADGMQWLRDHFGDLPPTLASAALLCILFAGVGVLLATYAERRSFALVAILATFLITMVVVQIVVSVVDSEGARYAVLASPIHVMRGFTLSMFDAVPALASREGDLDRQIAFANLPGAIYVAVALGYTTISAAITIRRYRGDSS